jgi:3-deoxy-D-manno-octulosonic-acid transferase
MALPPPRKSRVVAHVGGGLGRLIALVRNSSKVVSEPADISAYLSSQHPCIAASWHGQFMMLPAMHSGPERVAAMVARHGDAEIIGEALRRFNVVLIRGAGAGSRLKDRGGAQALRLSVRALADGASLVMTADIPPGPARVAGLGIVTIARMSGRPIVPVAAATSRYWAFPTWSRLTINLPWSRLAYVAAPPILVPRDADEATLEAKRVEVERALNAVTARAYELAGADPARATPPPLPDPDGPPEAPGRLLGAYRRVMGIFPLVAPLMLKVRERQGKEDHRRRQERYGEASAARPQGQLVWAHAASVGEAHAIIPVLDALMTARPQLNVLLTTGTVTSAGIAARRLGPRAIHQYVPLDVPRYARTFLDHWRPDVALFTESEIWPNLLFETAARRIPIILANARLSSRSFARWSRLPAVSRPMFGLFTQILAQSEQLARRFVALGGRRVIDAGNLKIDAPPPPVDKLELERLRQALGGRPVFMAASTHDGEELLVAQAHRRIARDIERFCTIIAPRHPERGTAVAEQLKGLGLVVAQRSLGQVPDARTDIYIADTIGELGTFYKLAPMAFIGGSLVQRGGQNPIEAVRLDAVPLTGPNWQNFIDSYRALIRHKGALEVKSAEELADVVIRLHRDPAETRRMIEGGRVALATLSGALERTVNAVISCLPEEEQLQRAS